MNYYVFKPCKYERFNCVECTQIYKKYIKKEPKRDIAFVCPSNSLGNILSNHNIFVYSDVDNKIMDSYDIPCFAEYYINDLIYKLLV